MNTASAARPGRTWAPVRRAVLFVLAAVAFAIAPAAAQPLTIGAGASFSGSGKITVKGNIVNTGVSSTIYIPGRVNLTGGAQAIGVDGNGGLTFDTLSARGTGSKTIAVVVTVNDSLTVDCGSGNNLVYTADTVKIGKTFGVVSGSLTNSASSRTEYTRNDGTAQTVLGRSYNGTLALSGNSRKSLSATTSADTLVHSGWAFTASQNLTVNGRTALDTLLDVSASRTVALGATAGTISRIASITSGGVLTVGTAPLTVTTLAGNSGTINGGNGGITFTNAATNGGKIAGGSGLITFSGTVAHSTDSIKAGTGGVTFASTVTYASGAITSTAGTLTFNGNVANSGTGGITLTGSAQALFAGSVNNTNLSFASGTNVTFNGATQTIPAATYGKLTIAGSAYKTAGGSFTVLDSIALSRNLNMGADSLTFSNAVSTVSGDSSITGKVRRTHSFAASTWYSFNRDSVAIRFAAIQANPVTITMQPATTPSGSIGSSYINRKYGVYSTASLASTNADLKLVYTDAEKVSIVSEGKLGIQRYDGSAWSKMASNNGNYYRDTVNNRITLFKANEGFGSSAIELACVPISFVTVKSGDIKADSTWGGTPDDKPTGSSDAGYVRHAVTVGSASVSLGTLTIQSGYSGSITVDGGNLTATSLTIQTGRSLQVNAGRTLQLNGTLTTAGAITNNGIILVQ